LNDCFCEKAQILNQLNDTFDIGRKQRISSLFSPKKLADVDQPCGS